MFCSSSQSVAPGPGTSNCTEPIRNANSYTDRRPTWVEPCSLCFNKLSRVLMHAEVREPDLNNYTYKVCPEGIQPRNMKNRDIY